MSMKAYLAEKYMSGPKADAILAQAGSGKKKKRKAATGAAGTAPSFIVDEDVSGFARIHVEDDDESAAPVVASDRGFKKRRTAPDGAGWSTVREPTPPPAADEQPQLVDDDVSSASVPAPAFAGGLLSKAQVARALPGAAASSSKSMTKDEIAAAQETVYRDASGRKIDMTAERAAAAEKKRARELKEAEKMEWGKGLVQRDAAEEARKQLERMKTTAFARTVDDAALNAEQKDVERWNDPAAQFLSKKKSKGPRRPEYTGPAPPPNRFGIKPGYRWDGVDRSTGFEQKLFQRQNERKRTGAASYSWSAEDM